MRFTLIFAFFSALDRVLLTGIMPAMIRKWILPLAISLLVTLILAACSVESPEFTATPVALLEGTLRPYPTDTPTVTPLPTDFVTVTPSPTITPTATQVFYDVQDGEDMGGISFRFGILVSALMTANPEVNPRAMGVGTTLLIPITPEPETTPTIEEDITPTPTPLFKALDEPNCYFNALGGLWCFVLVENDSEGTLENVSAEMVLQVGEEQRSVLAMMPLNLLPAGESLPLVAYFEPPVPEDFSISAAIDFLLPVMPEDQRYLPVEIADSAVTIARSGLTARVRGELVLPDGEPATRYIWLNATAFDADGRVVAVRRWESPNQLTGGEETAFSLMLYSLGDEIERVELLAEAGGIIVPVEEPET